MYGLNRMSQPKQIKFIVPSGFTGRFIIRENIPNGTEIHRVGGKYVFMIPPSGQLDVRGEDPIIGDWHQETIVDSAGRSLPLGDATVLPPHTRALYGGSCDDKGTVDYFVGTQAEWAAYRLGPNPH